MEKIISWRKGFFKRAYELSSNELPVGKLKENNWRDTAVGELNGKIYNFRARGFFNKKTEITGEASDLIIAVIAFNAWRTKATIEYTTRPEKTTSFVYNNFWKTKWSISDQSGRSVKYHGRQNRGEIISNLDDDMLILAGLYIASINWRAAHTAAAT